jgi:uncharacterized membrane protein
MFLPLFVIKKKYSGLVLDNWYKIFLVIFFYSIGILLWEAEV